MRGHRENRGCGLQCGWCLVVVGVITAIFTMTYVVGPALRGMAYQESLCTVESVNLGIDNMFNCRCTNYCRALAPCVHIFVDLQAVGESRLAHESLTSLEQFSQCSIDNRQCASASTQGNVAAAINTVDTYFPINATKPCWFHDSNVVFNIDVKIHDVVNAIVLPAVTLLIGTVLVCANSANCRDCGGIFCLVLLSPFYLLFYRGPKFLYQRIFQRQQGGHPGSPEALTPLNGRLDRTSAESTECAPPYAFDSDGRGTEFPPAYDNELRSSPLGQAVAVEFPEDDPPAYVPDLVDFSTTSDPQGGATEPDGTRLDDANGYLSVNA